MKKTGKNKITAVSETGTAVQFIMKKIAYFFFLRVRIPALSAPNVAMPTAIGSVSPVLGDSLEELEELLEEELAVLLLEELLEEERVEVLLPVIFTEEILSIMIPSSSCF